MNERTAKLEERIRELHGRGDLTAAATLAIEGFGPEVLGFLVATLNSDEDANEVFAMLAEDLWHGIGSFEWRSSFRTWLYQLARHAAWRYRRSPARRPGHNLALSQAGELAERVRSRTAPHLRTGLKAKLAEARASLDPEDRMLLVLRIDRGLGWNEIARVFDEGGELMKTAARLRKRFQFVKDDLRRRAAEEGWLKDG
jgi:RNA polymerase sigma-70 factor, ECF subfamily